MNKDNINPNPQQASMPQIPSTWRIPLRMKRKKRKDWQLIEEQITSGISTKDPELSARFRDIQHIAAGVHLPSFVNFPTNGFKKQFRQELNALKNQFKILKVGLQYTEHHGFTTQDIPSSGSNFKTSFSPNCSTLTTGKKNSTSFNLPMEKSAKYSNLLEMKDTLEEKINFDWHKPLHSTMKARNWKGNLEEDNPLEEEDLTDHSIINHNTMETIHNPEDNLLPWQIEWLEGGHAMQQHGSSTIQEGATSE